VCPRNCPPGIARRRTADSSARSIGPLNDTTVGLARPTNLSAPPFACHSEPFGCAQGKLREESACTVDDNGTAICGAPGAPHDRNCATAAFSPALPRLIPRRAPTQGVVCPQCTPPDRPDSSRQRNRGLICRSSVSHSRGAPKMFHVKHLFVAASDAPSAERGRA